MKKLFLSLKFSHIVNYHSVAMRRAWKLVKETGFKIGEAISTAYSELRNVGRVRLGELMDCIVVNGRAWLTMINDAGNVVDYYVESPIGYAFVSPDYKTICVRDNTGMTYEYEVSKIISVCKY